MIDFLQLIRGNPRIFLLDATTRVVVRQDKHGTLTWAEEDTHDMAWDSDSLCSCVICGHQEPLSGFMRAPTEEAVEAAQP